MGPDNVTTTQKYDGIIVQSSLLGVSIPKMWGTNKVGCNLMDYLDFSSQKVSSGKGGANPQYTYKATLLLGIVQGPIAGIRTIYKDQAIFTATASGSKEVNGTTVTISSKTPDQAAGLNGGIFTGAIGQTPWTYLDTDSPTHAIGYSGIAYAAAYHYPLDTSATPPNHNFEVQATIRAVIGGVQNDDANPADIVNDMLPDVPRWPANAIASLSTYSTYCLAQGLLLSPIADNGRQASDLLTEILACSNSDCVWSDGQLKIVPYGDTTITNNGATYTPNLTPLYALSWDDIIPNSAGEDPIQWDLTRTLEAYNYVQVNFLDRTLQYATNTATAVDQANINAYGRRQQSPQEFDSVCLMATASTIAQLMVQRSANVRRTAQFTVSELFGLLDPMDLITVPLRDGGDRLVRIVEANEQADGSIQLQVEEMLVGAAHAAEYTRQVAEGVASDFNVAPGDTNTPAIINPPLSLTNGANEVWIGASGGPNWGGAVVWASFDGDTYQIVGNITQPARYGTTTADFPVGSDPDTTHTLSVNLTVSGGELTSATQTDADGQATLCAVGTEIIAYSAATLTASYTYALGTYIRRGQEGTTIADQPAGSLFLRLDGSTVAIPYTSGQVGKTLYVKLQPFNIYGGGLVDLDLCEYYEFTAEPNGANVGDVVWSEIAGIPTLLTSYVDTDGTAVFAPWTGITDPAGTRPANNATVGATTGVNLFSSLYGTLSDTGATGVVTSQNTASSIYGQGSNATTNLYVGAVAPSSPISGDLWLDESTTPYTWRVYNDGGWRSGAEIAYSSTAPPTPNQGDLWVNTSVTPYTLSRFVGTSWVVISAAGATTGSTVYSTEYGVLVDVGPTGIVTGYNTASSISGQTSWATFSEFGTSVLTQPFGNIVYNPTFAIGIAGWAPTSFGPVAESDGSGAWGYLQTAAGPGYYSTYNSQDTICSPGETIYITASLGVIGGAGDSAYITVVWRNPQTAAIITYTGAIGTAEGPWQPVMGTAVAPTTNVPSGGYWQASIVIVIGKSSPAGTYCTGYFRNIMASTYGYFPFNDTLTSGALSTGIFSAIYGTQSEINILTNLGTASGIAGQGTGATTDVGALAVLSSLAFGSSYLTGFGGLAGLNNVETGLDGVGGIYSASYGWLADNGPYGIVTSVTTAAGIAGQGTGATTDVGALATLNSLSYGSSYLTGFSTLATLSYVSTGGSGEIYSSTYGFLYDNGPYGIVTSVTTAAGIAGQGTLATVDSVTQIQIVSGAAIQGTVYESDATTSYGNAGSSGITLASWSVTCDGTPLLVNMLIQSVNHSTNHFQYMSFYVELDGSVISSSVFPETLEENSQSLNAGQTSQTTSFFGYTPSAGTHTFSIVADHVAGTNNESSAIITRMYLLELRNQY